MAVLLYAAVRVSSHAQRNPGHLSTQCLLLGWLCQRDGERAGRLFRICIPPTLDKKLFFFFVYIMGVAPAIQYGTRICSFVHSTLGAND